MDRVTDGMASTFGPNPKSNNVFMSGVLSFLLIVLIVLLLACFCRACEAWRRSLAEDRDAVGGRGRGEDIQGLKGYFKVRKGFQFALNTLNVISFHSSLKAASWEAPRTVP